MRQLTWWTAFLVAVAVWVPAWGQDVTSILQQVEGNLHLYYVQHRDNWPDFENYPNWEQMTGRTDASGRILGNHGAGLGPYLKAPPVNPLRRASRVVAMDDATTAPPITDPQAGWVFSRRTTKLLPLDAAGKALPPGPARPWATTKPAVPQRNAVQARRGRNSDDPDAQKVMNLKAMGFSVAYGPVHHARIVATLPTLGAMAWTESTEGGQIRVVFNGIPQPEYKEILVDGQDRAVLSTDGSTLAYVARVGEDADRATLVINGKEIATHRRISRIALSGNGQRYAYLAHEGEYNRPVLYLDGTRVDEYFAVGDIAFSDSGELVVWAAAKRQPLEQGQGYDVYVNGKRFDTAFRYVGTQLGIMAEDRSIVISPNGRRWAIRGQVYGPRNGGIGGYAVVCDGVPGPVLGDVVPGTMRFSRDSRDLFYAGGTPELGPYNLYRNGVAGKSWNYIGQGELYVSQDGRTVAFTGYSGGPSRFTAFHPDSGQPSWSPGIPCLIINDELRVPGAGAWAISPDGRHVLAVKMEMSDPMGGEIGSRLLLDGRDLGDLGQAGGEVQFSPDGRSWLCSQPHAQGGSFLINGTAVGLPDGMRVARIGFRQNGDVWAELVDMNSIWQVSINARAIKSGAARRGRDH